jgi:hypothetical protein
MYVLSKFGIAAYHNRKIAKPGYSEQFKVGGCADTERREVMFMQDCDDVTAIVAIAHEVGHVLESDDAGLDEYQWRKAVDLYELEREAWARASDILADWEYSALVVVTTFESLRAECLKSYHKHTMSVEYRDRQTKLLRDGHE